MATHQESSSYGESPRSAADAYRSSEDAGTDLGHGGTSGMRTAPTSAQDLHASQGSSGPAAAGHAAYGAHGESEKEHLSPSHQTGGPQNTGTGTWVDNDSSRVPTPTTHLNRDAPPRTGGADSDLESNAVPEKSGAGLGAGAGAAAGVNGLGGSPKRGYTLKRKTEAITQMRTLRKYQAIYISIVLVQTIVVVVLASIVFGKVEEQIINQNNRLKSVTTYLAVFIMANVFSTLLSLDALQNKNTMQLFALVVFDFMMMVYGAVLPGQVKTALLSPGNTPAGETATNGCNYWLSCYGTSPIDGLYDSIQGKVIAIPIITGVCAILMGATTWLLYKENGWEIFKEIGADITLKRVYSQWQIFSVLNKFNFFFFVGFSIQLLILVDSLSSGEKGVTIAAVPVSILVIALAAWGVRREIHILMALFFLCWAGALVYYFYKLVRILNDAPAYDVAQRSLSLFAFLSIFTLLATGLLAGLCWASFGKGLKQQSVKSEFNVLGWMKRRGGDEEKEPARMTLDD